jgi:flagellar biosynthesis protein
MKSGRKRAVALNYAAGDKAPQIAASGAGEIAKKILELAKEHDVPIRRDDSLTEILAKLNVGFEIPPQTYRAVAEILAFLYRTDEAWRKRKESAGGLVAASKNPPEEP